MYAYHKGLHKIQNHYIEKYNLIHLSEIVAEKHLEAIIKVLKNSSNFGQINQLLENIEEDLVYSHYTKVLKGVIGEYQKKFLAIENSTSMKIGIFFTTPILRIMKSLKFKA